MVYMNGDNNLEQDALDNFRDMAKIGSSDKLNIIVQFDRIGKYGHTYPDWTQTLRFKVAKGMEPLPAQAVEDIGEANMGDQKTLQDFVAWSMKQYPAKHYMLDIWDHGSGYRLMLASGATRQKIQKILDAVNPMDKAANVHELTYLSSAPHHNKIAFATGDPFRSSTGSPYRSCSNDETNNDELYNREIEDGLKGALGGGKIDVIGFDCCLMAMIETAYALRSVGSVMVGSEELEPGAGWQYDDWLQGLATNTSINGQQLGQLLVDSYKKAYGNIHIDPTTTMAALDLGKVPDAATAISQLADALTKQMASNWSTIKTIRGSCSNFAPDYSDPNPFYHVDILHFCQLVKQKVQNAIIQTAVDNTINLVSGMIIANYAGVARQGNFGGTGMAIYFPPSGNAYKLDAYAKNGYEKNNNFYPVEFVKNELWSDFLHIYFKYVPQN
jgi:hypothetical protein